MPKKGNKYRMILVLSRLNDYMHFPKFKYDSIRQASDVFELGDFCFTADLKDGYWHCDLHADMFTHMCFEWLGVVYYFAVLPFGCAPACWVFTKLMKPIGKLRARRMRNNQVWEIAGKATAKSKKTKRGILLLSDERA